MNLPTEIFGDVIVVHAPEEMALEHAEKLEGRLSTLERVKVVLDLDGVETLDSAGLTTMVNVQETLRSAQGDLKIATANATNRKILEITRLDQRLDVFESVIDAVKSYR